MLLTKITDRFLQHPISALKVQTIYTPERDKEDRPLVPPLLAQRIVLADFQSLKQSFAVLADVKEVSQHVHAQCFAEPPGAGNEHHLDSRSVQYFPNQAGFIDVIASALSDPFKVRRSDR